MNKTIKIKPSVLGVDLMSTETQLPDGTVREAVNVDISTSGTISRRHGFTKVVSENGLHSLYYAKQFKMTLVMEGSILYRLNPKTYATAWLFDLASAAPVDYTEYNGNIYFSNIHSTGWIKKNTLEVSTIGLAKPQAPDLSVTSGSLPAGKYALAITLVNQAGEESPASDVRTIELSASGGVRLSNLPIAAGHVVYVYLTSENGDILRYNTQFFAVFPSFSVSMPSNGGSIETQFLAPLAPGRFIRWHAGRLYTAKDNVLTFSEPLRPHLYSPAYGVIPFSGEISFIEPVADGIYVGDSYGVWFLSGQDPSKFEQSRVSTCAPVFASSLLAPAEHFGSKIADAAQLVAVWLSTSGYVLGLPGGNVVEIHPERIRIPAGLSGRSAFIMRDGRKHVLTLVNTDSTAAPGIASNTVIE